MPLAYALLLAAVLGYAEYAYGAWWTAAAFLFGHVTATLLVYGVLRRTAGPGPGERWTWAPATASTPCSGR